MPTGFGAETESEVLSPLRRAPAMRSHRTRLRWLLITVAVAVVALAVARALDRDPWWGFVLAGMGWTLAANAAFAVIVCLALRSTHDDS
jgi:hypothetical protein